MNKQQTQNREKNQIQYYYLYNHLIKKDLHAQQIHIWNVSVCMYRFLFVTIISSSSVEIMFARIAKYFFRDFARNLIMHFCLEIAISCLTTCNILNCWAPRNVCIFVKKITIHQCLEADSWFIVFTTDVFYCLMCTFMYFETRCKNYFLKVSTKFIIENYSKELLQ